MRVGLGGDFVSGAGFWGRFLGGAWKGRGVSFSRRSLSARGPEKPTPETSPRNESIRAAI
jgi:hypothetical protein